MRSTLRPWLSWVGFAAALCCGLAAAPTAAMPDAQTDMPGAQTEQIYALPGVLRPASGQAFDTFLVTSDGIRYGLVGKTPDVERQIIQIRDQSPDTLVKVWGTLYPQGRTSTIPEIVADAIQASVPGPTPTATLTATPASPTPTPNTSPTATTRYQAVNVRAGPGTNYPVVTTLGNNVTCSIIGRNASSTWWQVRCPAGVIGWMSNDVVTVAGNTAGVPVVQVAPPPTVQPTPVPTSVPTNVWRASYYTNNNLQGAPVTVSSVGDINFNFGTGSPAAGVPNTNYSIRFERAFNLDNAEYEFRITYDDGVRVSVNGQRLIDDWRDGSARTSTARRVLADSTTVVIEYYNAYGEGLVQFSLAPVRTSADWQVSYWNNLNLSGNPALVRGEARSSQYPLDYNWGSGSPVPGVIANDNWSARWVGTFYFDAGDYEFQANADDGARIYIDAIRIVDAWSDGYSETRNRFYGIGAGNHEIRVDFYERTGGAALRVWWWRINTSGSGGSSGGSGRSRDE